ncbi:hypothetical protein NQ317_017169 [Molorchus minor]|uniref:Uncharacterized protein n=1 Tax=Molorchus minor TaxID=1323400 RepID=A0ABQ9IXK3_9CUCU|nr:hypothetical protein NQ317_017169 [Molorchus minor]
MILTGKDHPQQYPKPLLLFAAYGGAWHAPVLILYGCLSSAVCRRGDKGDCDCLIHHYKHIISNTVKCVFFKCSEHILHLSANCELFLLKIYVDGMRLYNLLTPKQSVEKAIIIK